MEAKELVREYHRVVRSYAEYPRLRRSLNELTDFFVGSLDFFREDPRRIDCVLRQDYRSMANWDLGILQLVFEERLVYGNNGFKSLEMFLDLLEFK
ncbi:hypothetical protein HOD38_04630 [archaeon]|jgi:hypothetical protein|nr:hypothetical protein [archaeon]MBT4397528.1 hypothetical protein [archaeon]MBT4440785.1 hypothetical protein [archaeon]